MKVTTPILMRFGKTQWGRGEDVWLCAKELARLFEIPKTTKHISLELSGRPLKESVIVYLYKPPHGWWRYKLEKSRKGQIFAGGAVDTFLEHIVGISHEEYRRYYVRVFLED